MGYYRIAETPSKGMMWGKMTDNYNNFHGYAANISE
jgi:hypothetical protein